MGLLRKVERWRIKPSRFSVINIFTVKYNIQNLLNSNLEVFFKMTKIWN